MDSFIGQIIQVGFSFAPPNWLMCDGKLYPIAENEALFALIGVTYGGDGVNSFAVPDLRARMAIHQGVGGGGTYPLGMMAGLETVTLISPQNPQHNHPISAQNVAPSPAVPSPSGNFFSASPVGQFGTSGANVTANLLAPAGGSQPHENRMPSIALYYIICSAGIYPSPA